MKLVRVTEGRVVPDPRGGNLDPGKTYRVNERDPNWAFLLRAGDLVEVSADATAAAAKATTVAAPVKTAPVAPAEKAS